MQSWVRTDTLYNDLHIAQNNKWKGQLIEWIITVSTLLINWQPCARHKILRWGHSNISWWWIFFQCIGLSASCVRANKLYPIEHSHWNRVWTFCLFHLICIDFIYTARLLSNWTRKHLFKHNSMSSIFSETWKTCEVSAFKEQWISWN